VSAVELPRHFGTFDLVMNVLAHFAWLISHDWKYCSLICFEREILFVRWKSMTYKISEQGRWMIYHSSTKIWLTFFPLDWTNSCIAVVASLFYFPSLSSLFFSLFLIKIDNTALSLTEHNTRFFDSWMGRATSQDMYIGQKTWVGPFFFCVLSNRNRRLSDCDFGVWAETTRSGYSKTILKSFRVRI
jgi:hypothetical protein